MKTAPFPLRLLRAVGLATPSSSARPSRPRWTLPRLISLLRAAKRFVVANTKMMWRKAPDRRIEYPEYPERAYEECIVNGLIHRDYLELGGELHIDIFDDRMEFFSPGAMPSGKMAENAPSDGSKSRQVTGRKRAK